MRCWLSDCKIRIRAEQAKSQETNLPSGPLPPPKFQAVTNLHPCGKFCLLSKTGQESGGNFVAEEITKWSAFPLQPRPRFLQPPIVPLRQNRPRILGLVQNDACFHVFFHFTVAIVVAVAALPPTSAQMEYLRGPTKTYNIT